MKACCYYKDLDIDMQVKVNDQWRQKELHRRLMYYKDNTPESDYPWYLKTEYINNWTYPEMYLFQLCPVCGLPEVFSDTIKETGNECRTVATKCQCGNIYQFSA